MTMNYYVMHLLCMHALCIREIETCHGNCDIHFPLHDFVHVATQYQIYRVHCGHAYVLMYYYKSTVYKNYKLQWFIKGDSQYAVNYINALHIRDTARESIVDSHSLEEVALIDL